MELHNFFTYPTNEDSEIQILNEALPNLKKICIHVALVEQNGYYTMIGQMYAADISGKADPELSMWLDPIHFVWFNAFWPDDNNLTDISE